ncbi:membrane cofactor protein-like isoform 1-T3 [Anableps anableps]
MSLSVLCLLSCLGLAITSLAQQCSKPPEGSNMHLDDIYIEQKTFGDGTSVSFKCDAGYTATAGSSQITCTAGKWSPVQLKCQRKNCGTLEDVPNGNVEYKNGTEFGDRAVVTCNSGYTLVGQSVIRCDTQGWTGRVPTCDEMRCAIPADIVNGKFVQKKESYSFREVVSYSCNKDFALLGSKELTCSEDGEFHPAPPTCVLVECKDPQIENAFWDSGSRPPHRHGATVTYKCNSGYKMIGQPTLTCKIDSQWSSKFPECTSNGNAVVGGLIGASVTTTILLVKNYWM